jgi:hypothetical protein
MAPRVLGDRGSDVLQVILSQSPPKSLAPLITLLLKRTTNQNRKFPTLAALDVVQPANNVPIYHPST